MTSVPVAHSGEPLAAHRRILLADADAFFVAVARQADPEGAGRARLLIVGGSAERRGVVTSASYEARAYGVRSAMPMARALKLCPDATVVPVPMGLCRSRSRDIRRVLEQMAPVVSAASVDEWYLDLDGTEALYHHEPLSRTAHRIRDAVIAATGLTVSIGGGTNRLVAKLAVERAKPKPGSGADGVHIVPPGGEASFMAGLHLRDLPGVGPRLQERLERAGLLTVAETLTRDIPALERITGNERTARWLHARIRGVDESPVTPGRVARSISRDETFARDVHEDAELERELWRLVTRAASDLRAAGLRARTVTVRLRDSDFSNRQASRTLPEWVETERAIAPVALELLARLRRARRVPARLLGVALSSLGGGEEAQLGLFTDEPSAAVETARDRALTRAVDAVHARFGRDRLVPGRLA